MRLTLRTMLAYMDDILEPSDREEISRKIEDSEFARNLMQRIQESVQKSRLGAPKVNAKGLGLDANTVAEYLDNTLSGERVPDFERVCLESDVHLAEVAACHQVLTMVLGRPAEVDPAMKRRMYKIAERMTADAAASPADAPAAVIAGNGSSPQIEPVYTAPPRQRPEVPAYLREKNTRSLWRTALAAIVLLALFVAAVTMALGPLDHRNPVLRAFGLAKPPAQEVAQNNKPVDKPKDLLAADGETKPDLPPADSDAARNFAGPDTPAAGAGNDVTTLPPMPEPPLGGPTPDGPAIDSPMPMPPVTPPSSDTPMPAGRVEPTPILPPNTGAPSLPRDGEVPPQPMPPGGNGTAPMPRPDDVLRTDPGVTPRPGDVAGNTPAPMPGTTIPGAVPPEPMPPAADLPLGRFIPNKGAVLLRLDENTGHWDRVVQGAPLAAGDRLLVLPTYRPTIALSAGLTLQLSSETMIELEAADASGVPGIKMPFGRFVAMTTGQAGVQLRLTLGQTHGVVTFEDADATLGAEVTLYHPFGTDPEKAQALAAVYLFDASGALQWTAADGNPIKLTAMQGLSIAPHPLDKDPAGAPKAITTLPIWITRENILTSLAGASPKLADELADEKRPLLLILNEFANGQRVENRLLAAQCLALVDQFDPMIDGLNDERNRAYWTQLIATAQRAMTRSPATATRVREAFEQRRGQSNGQQLFRMLGGFTNEDLTTGGWAAELVKYLDDDSLDFRVLAITALTEITGRPLNYMSHEKNAVNRRPGVNRWKEELKAGRIVRKEPVPAK